MQPTAHSHWSGRRFSTFARDRSIGANISSSCSRGVCLETHRVIVITRVLPRIYFAEARRGSLHQIGLLILLNSFHLVTSLLTLTMDSASALMTSLHQHRPPLGHPMHGSRLCQRILDPSVFPFPILVRRCRVLLTSAVYARGVRSLWRSTRAAHRSTRAPPAYLSGGW
jgi:hypothetical protein